MTRVVNGIYDTVELDTGFFIPDAQVDILCEWMSYYAEALEKSWMKRGSEGDPKTQKHAKVRSFLTAVAKARASFKEEDLKNNKEGKDKTQ